MVNKDILIEYMRMFRLECHIRLDMVPGDIPEIPVFMYEGAHKVAKEMALKELNLSEEDGEVLDKVIDFFIEKVKELDHYGKADDLTIKTIESGAFSK